MTFDDLYIWSGLIFFASVPFCILATMIFLVIGVSTAVSLIPLFIMMGLLCVFSVMSVIHIVRKS